MKRAIIIGALALCLGGLSLSNGYTQSAEAEAEYFTTISGYYEVEIEELNSVAGDKFDATNAAVIYGIAQRSNKTPASIASMYTNKSSWNAVAESCDLNAVDFYIMVTGKINSKLFSPIFAKFSGTEPHHWKDISLSDKEISDLINLRVLASYHDYSLFDIMAMKDYGSDWPRINRKVASAKKTLLDKMAKDTL